jgi:hypothetical protein
MIEKKTGHYQRDINDYNRLSFFFLSLFFTDEERYTKAKHLHLKGTLVKEKKR